MLGALAAVALVLGTVSATLSVTHDGHRVAEQSRESVVQAQKETRAESSALQDRDG